MSKDHGIWQISQDRISKFENEVLKAVLPNARFSHTRMFGSPDIAPNSFEAKISTVDIFKDTPYEYKGNGNFIHFTSLVALKSILDFGWIRMSEFGNLIDKNELIYGAKVFENSDVSQSKIEYLNLLKENVFCLSACESNEITQKDPYLWEVYGDKGRGVFIEYSFTNKNPVSYIFGNIQYGSEALESLREIKRLAEKFKKENDNFFINEFLELIIEMESFHKSKRFLTEKEVRLIFRHDKSQYEEHNHQLIYKDINSSQEIKYFAKLFIKNRNPHATPENVAIMGDEVLFSIFPQIELKKITLGFNIPIEEKIKITHLLNKMKSDHNYDFEIWQMNEEVEIFKIS